MKEKKIFYFKNKNNEKTLSKEKIAHEKKNKKSRNNIFFSSLINKKERGKINTKKN